MSTILLPDSRVQESMTIEQKLLDDYSPQTVALAYHLSGRASTYDTLAENCADISVESDDAYYQYGRSRSYAVVDDNTADKLWEDSLYNYIDDCILPELPSYLSNYFDKDSWISDARYDGRGHSLATYDGNEHEEIVDGVEYFIFRTN